MHVHVSLAHFLITWLYIVVGGFLLRAWSHTHPDSTVAKAVAFIY